MKYLVEYFDWKKLNENSNGALSTNLLIPIVKKMGETADHRLNPEAAAAYNAMVEAAEKAGIRWKILQSYRALGSESEGCSKGFTQWCAWKKYKSGKGNLAARPGTSNHGWGSAVDITVKKGDSAWNWLNAAPSAELAALKSGAKTNAEVFGFTTLARNIEPWHWEHKESAKKLRNGQTLTPVNTLNVGIISNQLINSLK